MLLQHAVLHSPLRRGVPPLTVPPLQRNRLSMLALAMHGSSYPYLLGSRALATRLPKLLKRARDPLLQVMALRQTTRPSSGKIGVILIPQAHLKRGARAEKNVPIPRSGYAAGAAAALRGRGWRRTSRYN